MTTKRPAASTQGELFGGPLACQGMENCPLIVDRHVGHIEVMAPGSVYQPLLLKPREDFIDVGPGHLDQNEERFVRDLIHRLYPAGNHPKSPKTPLKWGEREIWLKRNIEKRDDSFRLRVDDSDWFYPDFIVWILDHEARIQTFGFVDPKGMALGTAAGWSDYKIVSTLYLPHVVEYQLATTGQSVTYQGEPWTFRVRGALVSTASFASLSAQAKFQVRDAFGNSSKPTEADFRRGRVLFPRDDTGYIDQVLTLLTQDTEMDPILALAAQVLEPTSYFTPVGELQHELRLRQDERNQPDAEFIGALLADYLQPDAAGQLGTAAIKRRRQQLMDYAIAGRFGFGAETVVALRDHPAPCEALWTRKQKAPLRP
ncbi:MAG TPA: hypothetical protein VES73_09795 [Lamprocystis sp. (in: g-proteobacteria)]|nr:hypothetical protein [Lamprocystis sp. (in: g-proteobacteria)]